MKRSAVTLVILVFFTACRVVEKESSEAVVRKVARKIELAEIEADSAKKARASVESARRAGDFSAAKLGEDENREHVEKLNDLLKEIESDRKNIQDPQYSESPEKILDDSNRVEAEGIALNLDQLIDEDVERVKEEEPSMTDRCLDSVRRLNKDAVCLYLKTYIKNGQVPKDDEFGELLLKSASHMCAPLEKQRNWVKTSKAVASVAQQIANEPDDEKKLALAVRGYFCEIR